MSYRERLRALREDRGLTQSKLGQILNKTQQAYCCIETGQVKLSIDDLARLCEFYGVSADYIIGLCAKPVPPGK